MDKQAVFDKVRSRATRHIKALDVFGHCRYRTKEDERCFIGALIKDKAYTAELEGRSPSGEWVHTALAKSGIEYDIIPGLSRTSDEAFLGELQHIHDNYEPEEWEANLKKICKEHKLIWHKASEIEPYLLPAKAS